MLLKGEICDKNNNTIAVPHIIVEDLNPLDVKAYIAVQTSRPNSLQNLQFNCIIKYGSVL